MGDSPSLADDPDRDDTDERATGAEARELVDDQNGPTEAVVELSDDDLRQAGNGAEVGADDDVFTGVEQSDQGDDDDEGDTDEDTEDEEIEDVLAGGLEGDSAAMEGAINDGAARFAVVGLTEADMEGHDLTKSELETEFRETFAAFRLGYFGTQVVEEYVLAPADEDISPMWGLLGSILLAGAMAVWLRPDGDQAVEKARNAIGDLGGGA